MKLIEKHRRKIIGMMIAMAVFAAMAIWLHLYLDAIRHECGYGETILSKNASGDIIDATEEVCGRFGAMLVVSVKLIKHDTKQAQEFFLYVPTDSTPTLSNKELRPKITWNNDHSVTIKVVQISDIIKKSARVDDVNVYYDIGKVEFDQSQGAK